MAGHVDFGIKGRLSRARKRTHSKSARSAFLSSVPGALCPRMGQTGVLSGPVVTRLLAAGVPDGHLCRWVMDEAEQGARPEPGKAVKVYFP